MADTPFERSSRSAIWQNGQTPVLYMVIFAMSAASALFERQTRLLPRRDAAAQGERFGEAFLAERAAHARRARSGRAGDDDRPRAELVELLDAVGHLRLLDV